MLKIDPLVLALAVLCITLVLLAGLYLHDNGDILIDWRLLAPLMLLLMMFALYLSRKFTNWDEAPAYDTPANTLFALTCSVLLYVCLGFGTFDRKKAQYEAQQERMEKQLEERRKVYTALMAEDFDDDKK